MTALVIVAILASWVLFSAALAIVLCMFSSRLSEAEGRDEVWTTQPQRTRPSTNGAAAAKAVQP